MTFKEKYNNIKSCVKDEFKEFENFLFEDFNKMPLDSYIIEFMSHSAKRIRPLLGILYAQSLNLELNKNLLDALVAIELIHNASLIHDDIIDNANTRRNTQTLNKHFNNNLAVIAGDYLLSIALQKIIDTNSHELLQLCTSAINKLCRGEISQYFNKFKQPTLDEYIEKTTHKTASLFALTTQSVALLSEKDLDLTNAKNLGLNFGIAFQIRDDLINFVSKSNSNDSDIKNGIYTAPIILGCNDNAQKQNLYDIAKQNGGLEKTINLIDTYLVKAKNALNQCKNDFYKNQLICLIDLLKEKNYET